VEVKSIVDLKDSPWRYVVAFCLIFWEDRIRIISQDTGWTEKVF
jgi:hypothetical protein